MLLHPTNSLFNAGLMDSSKDFLFYKEGATKSICMILEKIESEINKIFNKLGLRQAESDDADEVSVNGNLSLVS